MHGIKVQVTLQPSTAALLARRARNHPRGRAGLVAQICEAYALLICDAECEPGAAVDVAGDVEEMFRIYTEAEAPDYGARALRKHSRHV